MFRIASLYICELKVQSAYLSAIPQHVISSWHIFLHIMQMYSDKNELNTLLYI